MCMRKESYLVALKRKVEEKIRLYREGYLDEDDLLEEGSPGPGGSLDAQASWDALTDLTTPR